MRLELFFKTAGELQALLSLVRGTGIGKLNLVNKDKADPLLQHVRAIKSVLPEVDVCPHYSLKYQYRNGSADLTFDAFRGFCAAVAKEGVREVLLVSGSGSKKQLDAVSCLQRIAEEKKKEEEAKKRSGTAKYLDALSFGVAFNPFLPEEGGLLAEEQRRLKAKVATGVVSSVWLQLGADPAKLARGLDFLQAATAGRRPPIRVVGSVAIPSKKFLAMMRFRPWGGVYLDDEYLSSVEAADQRTRQLLDVYRKYSVEPIVETAVKTEADMDRVRELLGDLFVVADHPDPASASSCPATDSVDGDTSGSASGSSNGDEGSGMQTRSMKRARTDKGA